MLLLDTKEKTLQAKELALEGFQGRTLNPHGISVLEMEDGE